MGQDFAKMTQIWQFSAKNASFDWHRVPQDALIIFSAQDEPKAFLNEKEQCLNSKYTFFSWNFKNKISLLAKGCPSGLRLSQRRS